MKRVVLVSDGPAFDLLVWTVHPPVLPHSTFQSGPTNDSGSRPETSRYVSHERDILRADGRISASGLDTLSSATSADVDAEGDTFVISGAFIGVNSASERARDNARNHAQAEH